jgi:hypothetical protein
LCFFFSKSHMYALSDEVEILPVHNKMMLACTKIR